MLINIIICIIDDCEGITSVSIHVTDYFMKKACKQDEQIYACLHFYFSVGVYDLCLNLLTLIVCMAVRVISMQHQYATKHFFVK